MKLCTLAFTASLFLAGTLSAFASEKPAPARPAKKFLSYGWDTPAPAYVRDHIREMENALSTASPW